MVTKEQYLYYYSLFNSLSKGFCLILFDFLFDFVSDMFDDSEGVLGNLLCCGNCIIL